MKTYQSGTKEKKKNFFARHKYAFIIAVSVIVVATVIVLSVVFTLPKKPVDSGEDVTPPPPVTDVDTPPTIVMPVSSGVIGLDYADDRLVRWETLEIWKWHPAVDFVGSGDVYAIMNGTVTDIEKTTLDGNVITITHDNGYVSIYKSVGADIPVKVGDTVKAGDKIGVTSASMMSELNTGDHLHFELKKDGKYVNPASILPIDEDK